MPALLVSKYAKWKTVDDLNQVSEVVGQAIEDELVRALRDPARPARVSKLEDSKKLSIARCEQMWRALGVDQPLAQRLATDQNVGAADSDRGPGVHVLTGEIGVGKTLAAERIFQSAIDDALVDPSKPMPLFLQRPLLSEPINEYVDRMSQGFWQPEIHGAFLVIDGLDEIGVTSANRLFNEISAYANSNPRVTAVIAARPLPGMDFGSDLQEVPVLEEQAALKLIGDVAGREINRNDTYGWSPTVLGAIKWPLFAILLGTELQGNENLHSITPITLVERLADRALARSGEPAMALHELLEQLAIETIKRGRAVRSQDAGLSHVDQGRLVDSRLVKSGREGIDFTIPLMREWFAAQAIIDRRTTVNEIVSQGTTADRWLVPLAISVQSGPTDVAKAIMTELAREDVGFASLVLDELSDPWYQEPDEVFNMTSVGAGEAIRQAMSDWSAGFGDLFSQIGPATGSSEVPPIGIRLEGRFLTTSWYGGPDESPLVRDLPDVPFEPSYPDWPSIRGEKIPDSVVWPWLFTKRWLVESLSTSLNSLRLAYEAPAARSELVWAFAESVRVTISQSREGLSIDGLISYVDQSLSGHEAVQFPSAVYYRPEIDLIRRGLQALAGLGA